jgi:hypothetical protein
VRAFDFAESDTWREKGFDLASAPLHILAMPARCTLSVGEAFLDVLACIIAPEAAKPVSEKLGSLASLGSSLYLDQSTGVKFSDETESIRRS